LNSFLKTTFALHIVLNHNVLHIFGNFSRQSPSGHRLTSVVSKIVKYVHVQDMYPKDRIALLPLPKKHILRHSVEPLGRFPPIFCVIPHCCSSLVFRVLSQLVQVWQSYSREKPFAACQSDCNIGYLSLQLVTLATYIGRVDFQTSP